MDITRAMTGVLTGIESAQIYAAEINFAELDFIELTESDFVSRLPNRSSVYFVLDQSGRPVYIGKAIRLQERWRNHHCLRNATNRKGMRLAWIEAVPAFLMILESLFIMVFSPVWNQGEFTTDEDYLMMDDPRRLASVWKREPVSIWANVDASETYVPIRG